MNTEVVRLKTGYDDLEHVIGELNAVAKVTDSLLTGYKKKVDFNRYIWFYENVTDILARHIAAIHKGRVMKE